MPDLDVDQRAVVAGERRMLALIRATNPAARRVHAMLVAELALDNEYLLATLVPVRLKPGIRRPADERDMLALVLVQRQHFEPIDEPGRPLGASRIDHALSLIVRRELLQLDENDAALLTNTRRMGRANRIPHVGTGGIASVFVAELSVNDEILLTTRVHVARKPARTESALAYPARTLET